MICRAGNKAGARLLCSRAGEAPEFLERFAGKVPVVELNCRMLANESQKKKELSARGQASQLCYLRDGAVFLGISERRNVVLNLQRRSK